MRDQLIARYYFLFCFVFHLRFVFFCLFFYYNAIVSQSSRLLDQIGDIRWHLFDTGVVECLNIIQRSLVVGCYEVDCYTLTAETSTATDSAMLKKETINCRAEVKCTSSENLIWIDIVWAARTLTHKEHTFSFQLCKSSARRGELIR